MELEGLGADSGASSVLVAGPTEGIKLPSDTVDHSRHSPRQLWGVCNV